MEILLGPAAFIPVGASGLLFSFHFSSQHGQSTVRARSSFVSRTQNERTNDESKRYRDNILPCCFFIIREYYSSKAFLQFVIETHPSLCTLRRTSGMGENLPTFFAIARLTMRIYSSSSYFVLFFQWCFFFSRNLQLAKGPCPSPLFPFNNHWMSTFNESTIRTRRICFYYWILIAADNWVAPTT